MKKSGGKNRFQLELLLTSERNFPQLRGIINLTSILGCHIPLFLCPLFPSPLSRISKISEENTKKSLSQAAGAGLPFLQFFYYNSQYTEKTTENKVYLFSRS